MKTRILRMKDFDAGTPEEVVWEGDLACLPRRGDDVNIGTLLDEPAWETVVAVRHDLRDGSVDLFVPCKSRLRPHCHTVVGRVQAVDVLAELLEEVKGDG